MSETTNTSSTVTSTAPWWGSDYPNQYYAMQTSETLGGYPLLGWVDVSLFQAAPSWLPAASELLPLTAQQWSARTSSQILVDGKIEQYTPPAITVAEQAATLLKTEQAAVMQRFTVYGDDTPADWVTYLKALRAIANGTDTTSTALPEAPKT